MPDVEDASILWSSIYYGMMFLTMVMVSAAMNANEDHHDVQKNDKKKMMWRHVHTGIVYCVWVWGPGHIRQVPPQEDSVVNAVGGDEFLQRHGSTVDDVLTADDK